MRAKRSKKYRKLMNQYALTFGFREPYQVLVDSYFLASLYANRMDLITSLERTLQGKVKPMITKCTLAHILSSSSSDSATAPHRRPPILPPPLTLPLRHCSHNADSTPIPEKECLLSLLSPGSEGKKGNKEHYILATADPAESQAPPSAPRDVSERREARQIPGVPIIYIKRSVMVLEPMSSTSEQVRDGVERGKFRSDIIKKSPLSTGKRKRDDDGEDEVGVAEDKSKKQGGGGVKKEKKVKEPNPLSVLRSKKTKTPGDGNTETGSAKAGLVNGEQGQSGADGIPKARRRRKRRSSKSAAGGGSGGEGVDVGGESD